MGRQQTPPKPTQLCVWNHRYVLREDSAQGQYLYALNATEPGDRQLIWEGASNRGFIGVVDFDDTAVKVGGRFYAWGGTTLLKPAVTKSVIERSALLNDRFLVHTNWLAGRPKRLDAEIAAAVEQLAGGWPPQRRPTGDRLHEPFERWHGMIEIDPEEVFELAILTSAELRRQIGFSSAVVNQKRISPRSRPDLFDDDKKLIGEVKREIRPRDAEQVERYLADVGNPTFRVALIHNGEMSAAVAQRLDASDESERIEVWRLNEQRNGGFKAVQERKARNMDLRE
jgi:hypothetical protein